MSNWLKNLAPTLVVLGVFAVPVSAGTLQQANIIVSSVTYNFTGACSDCYGGHGNATATLTLSGYTLGSAFNASNFVSFTYTGTDLLPTFTITSLSPGLMASGTLPSSLPGYANVSVSSSSYFFSSMSDGTWSAGRPILGDRGTVGTYSALPEPATMGMLGFGLLGVALLSRRRS